ncbi:MAG: LOG family protein [Acidobacteriota bacterium]
MSPSSRPDALRLAFHGAARTVTGSKHLLDAHGARVLLDAGLFQGKKALRQRNWEDPPFDPASVDEVVLSHTHIDHVGFLPRLVAQGLRAPVHLTAAASELAKLMLLDSARLQEEDARRANRKGYSKHKPAEPLYTVDDAWNALDLRQREQYDQWFELAGGRLRARFHGAGHILGAAFVELEIPRAGEPPVRIVYSGDVGRYGVPLHRDPEPMPACDVLIVESTYGDRLHTTESVVDQLREPLRRCLGDGGTVLIPAFAVGRSQLVALVLRRLMQAGEIPKVPIHIDSPMAVEATGIYGHYLDAEHVDDDVFEDGRAVLFPYKVSLHDSTRESKALNRLKGPRILVSASGMLTGGRVLHHLARLAPDPKNLVLLAGYQPPGTRGWRLMQGERTVKVHGRPVEIRCRTLQVHGLSGHADRNELLRWIGSAQTPPRLVFTVHGEEEPALALAAEIEKRSGAQVRVPHLDESFDLAALLAEAPARETFVVDRQPASAPVPPIVRQQPLPETSPKAPEDDPEADERIRTLVAHPTYRHPTEDPDFLRREELRPVRLQLEYLKPHLEQRDRGIQATIAIFGGSRLAEPAAAQRRLDAAQTALAAAPDDEALALEVRRSERILEKSRYYDEARALGQIVGRAGGGPDDPRLVVVTGGGPGVMEAGNRGAHDVGAPSIGLNITLPHEQYPNPYITPDLAFLFRYFAIRKMHFLLRARALVAFPGGYGTLDELFETLCLIQTRKIEPLPVVLVGEDFWRGTFDVDHLIVEGTIDPEDADLFWYAETGQEVWDGLVRWYAERGLSIFDPVDHVDQEERCPPGPQALET